VRDRIVPFGTAGAGHGRVLVIGAIAVARRPAPEQPQETSCAGRNAERVRLLAERDDLTTPLRSSLTTKAQRDAELTQLNGKLYTLAKAQFDKSCLAVANGLAGSVVR